MFHQFTRLDFTGLLQDNGIRISMDGRGCWRENERSEFQWRLTFRLHRNYNVFVERLWKSVKYEEVYLHAYDSVSDAKRGLEKYFRFYNQNRPHTALGDKTPDEFYSDNLPALPKAAQALTARLPRKQWGRPSTKLPPAKAAGLAQPGAKD